MFTVERFQITLVKSNAIKKLRKNSNEKDKYFMAIKRKAKKTNKPFFL